MIDSNLKIHVSRDVYDPYNEDVRFYLRENHPDGFGIVQPLEVKFVPRNEIQGMRIEPTFRLDCEEAQKLMDDLWTAGLRPREGMGSAGSLSATQNHLKDLQRLVFKDFT